MATPSETTSYFTPKAAAYDLVDEQVYWRLSDELLWEHLREQVLPAVPAGGRFLDAGGGTGRWTDRVARAAPSLRGTVVDLTPAMLEVARAKAERHGYADRVEMVVGDLDRLDEVAAVADGPPFDLALCFHNVIGFVPDPQRAIELVTARLRPGGRFVLMAPSALHAAHFNLGLGRLDLAEAALAGRGRFTLDMPEIWMFTPADLERAFLAAGLEVVDLVGFPCLVYPGIEETRIEGTSAAAAKVLDDPETYARIFALERRALALPGTAARGNNLLITGRRV